MIRKIYTMQEWEKCQDSKLLWEWEKVLSNIVCNTISRKVNFPGKCVVCEKSVDFLLDDLYSSPEMLNYRERLVCPKCGLNNRQRALFGILKENKVFDKDIYIYEQVTPFFQILKNYCNKLIGSEYFGEEIISGTVMDNGIRHENALKLSFSDNSFDFIISQDVFEHVSDIHLALHEAYRVLRNNGKMFISVPFHWNKTISVQRSYVENGIIYNCLEPVYHGNPIDPQNGSLVFYDYGWDFLSWLSEAGFKEAYIVKCYSLSHGNIGADSVFFIIAEK